ncbi:MAG: Rrf2 family transcriptional regulator [Candidatus Nealsonbacteria bacterium]
MLKISTKSQYGLRAMVYLARSKAKICPLSLISKKEGISFDYLEKIISRLEKAGLVKSKKGVQGGYLLEKKPSKIRIGEIVMALEGKPSIIGCLAEKEFCPRMKKCLTRNVWKKLQEALIKALNSITLADLIK